MMEKHKFINKHKYIIAACILFVIVILIALLSGGGNDNSNANVTPDDDPNIDLTTFECRDEISTIALDVGIIDDEPVTFSTNGGLHYLKFHDSEGSGRGQLNGDIESAVYFGSTDEPPILNANRSLSTVTNALQTGRATTDDYSEVELPSGEYWALTTSSGELRISSCGSLSE